uniref:Urea amidolyase related protein n=1 Tax=Rhodopseudomonas palustris (strain BisA53) TaxID=316055 RepID=Q07M59_RHOP5
MSRLLIESIGPASSVQDAGRHGAQRYGLPPSGAMDLRALAIANTLLGNAAFAAAIEIGPLGAVFVAQGGAVRVALAGARRSAEAAGEPVALNASCTLQDGERLTLGGARSGVFSYLAIEGGVSGEATFGSLAVNARAGLGSPYPRPLQAGDSIATRSAKEMPERMLALPPATDGPIRVVLGPQHAEFGDAVDTFLTSDWTVSAASDRMGFRLEGPSIAHDHGHNIVSDGTVNGSIQIPGNGLPIVLMPDRGTTGGYPKIATVISADFARLTQTQPGQQFRFAAVTIATAQQDYRAMMLWLRSLPGLVKDAPMAMNLDALHDANIAGAAISALDA